MNDLKPNPIRVRLARLDDDLDEAPLGGVEQRLATLKTMRQSGLLTEAEYRQPADRGPEPSVTPSPSP